MRTNRQRFQKYIRRRRRVHWSRFSNSLICFASAKHPLRRTSCLRENHEVIGVANERQATPFQLLVQVIQEDVGQKWRERPALRRALRAGLQNPFDHHARPQVAADQLQQSLVTNLAGDATHQDVVLDPVKELRQVHVYDEAAAPADRPLHLLGCSVGG